MFYNLVEVKKEEKDVDILKKYKSDGMILRMGRFTSTYGYIDNKFLNHNVYCDIITMIKKGNPKYEVILKDDITKFYLDCEMEIPKKDDDFIYNLYVLLDTKLRAFLSEYNFTIYELVYLDSLRNYDDGFKVSLHVIVNSNIVFSSRKTMLNMVQEFKEYCSDIELLYNFIDTKPYANTYQLFRTILSKKDYEPNNVIIKPIYIKNNKIKINTKNYIESNLLSFFIKE
jgi:hypothetical protein